MSDATTDLLALHYRAFFQFSAGSWERIFEVEVPPFHAWQQFFGEPWEGFPLLGEQMEQLQFLTHLFAADTPFDHTLLRTFFKTLELLDVSHQPLDFDALDTVDGIHTIVATGCGLKDRDLARFTGCRRLIARFNAITSLDGLIGANPHIEDVNVQDNRLSVISGAARSATLRSLDCTRNILTDVSGLAHFPSLEHLHISNNLISNIDSVLELPELKELSLENNRFDAVYLERIIGELERRGVVIVADDGR